MDQRTTDRRRLGCLIFLLAALCFYGLLWLYSSSDSDAVSAIEGIGGNVEKGFSGTAVNFNNNTDVTDNDLKHLKGLLNVTGVSISNTRLTDAGLVHLVGLKKLRTLSLDDTAITDAGLEHLKKIPSLRHLYLTDTEVTNEGLKDLQKALPKCQLTPFPAF